MCNECELHPLCILLPWNISINNCVFWSFSPGLLSGRVSPSVGVVLFSLHVLSGNSPQSSRVHRECLAQQHHATIITWCGPSPCHRDTACATASSPSNNGDTQRRRRSHSRGCIAPGPRTSTPAAFSPTFRKTPRCPLLSFIPRRPSCRRTSASGTPPAKGSSSDRSATADPRRTRPSRASMFSGMQ